MLPIARRGRDAAARRRAGRARSCSSGSLAELPDPADEVLLDSLPISIYGGG